MLYPIHMSGKRIILTRAQAQRKESEEFKAKVIALVYGPPRKTQTEVAEKLRVTKGRVSQIVKEYDHLHKEIEG